MKIHKVKSEVYQTMNIISNLNYKHIITKEHIICLCYMINNIIRPVTSIKNYCNIVINKSEGYFGCDLLKSLFLLKKTVKV